MLAILWFENNYMKSNTDKCHLIVSGCKYEQVWANIDKDLIQEGNDVKLLGITIDRHLKFDKHFLKLCSKANQKLSALFIMAKMLFFNKRKLPFKAFVESQFKYCPIVWCFIVEVPTAKLICYIRELLEIVTLKTFQLLINCLLWTNLPVFTIQYPVTLS